MEGCFSRFVVIYLFPFGAVWKTTSKSAGDFPVQLDFHCGPDWKRLKWGIARVEIRHMLIPTGWIVNLLGRFSYRTVQNSSFKAPVVRGSWGSAGQAHRQITRKRRCLFFWMQLNRVCSLAIRGWVNRCGAAPPNLRSLFLPCAGPVLDWLAMPSG